MVARRWRLGGIIILLVSAFIVSRRFSGNEKLEGYFAWQAAYLSLQQQPSSYGFEYYAKSPGGKDFEFECIIYQDGSAAYEEGIGNHKTGARMRIIQPFTGRPRIFRDEAD